MALKTYKDGTPFTGVIGRSTEESSPAWPEPPRPPEGAPNVLFFVLDDVGYGQMSCFGGLVETPVIDSLAANGLRYTNMHTTAVCSPTRSSACRGIETDLGEVCRTMHTSGSVARHRRRENRK